MSDSVELLKLQQHFNLFLTGASLAVVAFGFAWLAYIDAPVTDVAIMLMAVATLLAVSAIVAAAVAGESAVKQLTGNMGLADRWNGPARKLIVACLALIVLLVGATCCLTATLKQVGTDDSEQTEATVLRGMPLVGRAVLISAAQRTPVPSRPPIGQDRLHTPVRHR